jgi:spermidine/putrescine transport system substrate-binding protein
MGGSEEPILRAQADPRRVSLALVTISTLVLAACGSGQTGDASGDAPSTAAEEPNELAVLEWSGYEAEDFWTDFKTANPDTEVTFEFGDTDANILAQMQGGSSADIFHFYTGWQQFYVDEGLVREIDTSKLTNWDKVPEDFKALGQIDGKQYFLPWDWGFTSILYNTEHVDEVTSWDVLFDPQYAEHVSMWNDGPAAVTVSSYVHGYDETAITDEQLADIEAEWIAQKPLNAFYWSSEYEDLCPGVQDGTVWIAYAWQGCYATALAAGDPVAYATPEEGRNSWVGLYGINADTESYNLALEFLDLKLAELSCSNAVTLFYYGCANADVMAAIDDPVLVEAFGIDDPSILASTNFTPLVTDEQREAWTGMWERVQAE